MGAYATTDSRTLGWKSALAFEIRSSANLRIAPSDQKTGIGLGLVCNEDRETETISVKLSRTGHTKKIRECTRGSGWTQQRDRWTPDAGGDIGSHKFRGLKGVTQGR
jgi:hypothetical protein